MTKKTLMASVPVAILIIAAVVPAMAQATRLQAPAGTELANSSTVLLQRYGDFTVQTYANEKKETPEAELVCKKGTSEGTSTANQVETAEATINKDALSECTSGGLTEDILSNASGAAPWRLQIQQPDSFGGVTAHIIPASGSTILYTVQIQYFGIDVASCVYSASSIHITGTTGSDIYTISSGNSTVMKLSGPKPCGQYGFLSGSYQMETGNGNPITVDMS